MYLCRLAPLFGLRASSTSAAILDVTFHLQHRGVTAGLDGQRAPNVGPSSNMPRSELQAPADSPASPMQDQDDAIPNIAPSGFGAAFPPGGPKGTVLGVRSLRHPRRVEFYHRRHREIKKFEKKQDRIHSLRAIAKEKERRGHHRASQVAAAEADRLEAPRLSTNVPVKPPPYASVSGGQRTAAKVAMYREGDGAKTQELDLKMETRKLDVLNLKVGYAIDAQYALPDEVKAFILDQSTFCLYGVDKNQVTQIAANIRRIRPPEPYKGHGIRIVGETIKLKDRKIK